MSKIFLETENLKKIFNHINGSITLFKDLNIKIKEGDLVALVGPSGSGKSSLLHLLALLDEPSKGKIILNNQEIKKWLDWGAGPRASTHLILAAKAKALLSGKSTPDIDDVNSMVKPVLRHRIVPNFNAEAEGITKDTIIDKLIS